MGQDEQQGGNKGFTVRDQRWWLNPELDLSKIPQDSKVKLPTYLEELETRLADKDRMLREYIQAHKSSVADMDEVRLRLQKELGRQVEIERARMAGPFLEVLDNLERLRNVHKEGHSESELFEGMDLIIRQFKELLSKLGMEPISTEGQHFDPRTMEALMTSQVEEEQDGLVLDEVRPGYLLGDQVVRPAGVRVGVARRG